MRKILVIALLVSAAVILGSPSFSYALDRTSATRPGFVVSKAVIVSGTVSSKFATQLVVSKDGKDYTVLFDSHSKFRRKFWGVSSLDEIQVGDSVNIIGKWTDEAQTTIQAIQIRDISIQKRFGVFFGTVTSVTSNGFVMATISRGNQTVIVGTSTKLIDRRENPILIGDIKVGDRVRVKGLWNKTNSTISKVTAIKDFSIPVKPSPTPTPTASPTPTATP